jgi:hypothetical protein
MRLWIVGLLLWAQPVWADWQFLESWIDPIDGAKVRSATALSDDGIALHLYRNASGRVYALFTLPEDSAGFVQSGIVAEITPEGFAPKKIELRDEPGRIVEYGLSTGGMLRDRLWHGQGETPAFGTLRNMIDAPAVAVTFQLADDTTFNTQWSMAGASLPIAQALGIKIEDVAAGAEWEDAASQSLLAAMTACQFPRLDVFCVQTVTTCSSKISEDRDIDGFEACVAQVKDDG